MEGWSGSGGGLYKDMRIGIFGGTFDPVHLGHLIIAQDVLETLGLDEVRFIPAAQPWMKKGREISASSHRLKMLELSVGDNPRFVVDLADLNRNGVTCTTYTIDTLNDLKKGLGEKAEFFFILGADALMGFPLWKEPSEIIKLAMLVAVPRPGYTVKVQELEKAVPGIGSRLVLLPEPCIGISGVDIRKRVPEGRSIRYLVAPGVSEYIKEQGLYL